LLHQKRAVEAAFDQASAQYRMIVIAALQNVADTLHALEADANALRAASEFERAGKISFDLVQQQFERGYPRTPSAAALVSFLV
jgi:outer membrane protein TolC